MKIPNNNLSFVADNKITDYLLSDIHEIGKHKADFQIKVQEYMKLHQGVSEQEAVQAVMAEFKARQTAQEIQSQSK